MQAYLAHLRDARFCGAAESLGVDEQARGAVVRPRRRAPQPAAAGDGGRGGAGRAGPADPALHEASAGWAPPPDAVWGGTPSTAGQVSGPTELVTHRNYYPGNVVFRDGRPVALIDFDLAKPTARLISL